MSRAAQTVSIIAIIVLLGLAMVLRLAPIGSVPELDPTPTPTEPGGELNTDWSEALAARMRPEFRPAAARPVARNPLSEYRLVGVVESESESWALLQGIDYLITAQIGQDVEGFELRSLTLEEAVFERGDEQVVLERVH